MTPDLPLTRDLVLIGGGHAHALVLRRWGMDPLPGARLTVINPGPTAPYTGMLPGHVAGHYTRDELDIDLVRLARFAGAALIDGAVRDIDPEARMLDLGDRQLAYDVASIDIGITGEMPDLPGFAEHAVPAKPLDRFARAWRGFRDRALAAEDAPRIAVIGGGVAGVELALAMAHALRARSPAVTILEAGATIGGVGDRVAARLQRAMRDLGVAFRPGVSVARVAADHVVLADGETIPADFTLGAAGARPHRWVADTPLPQEDGFIRVDRMLRVEGRDDLFAAGDCALLTHSPRPKAGVYAVRAAPVLHDNLRAALAERGLRPFRPQKGYLKLISLGAQAALAEQPQLSRAGIAPAGPLVWRWKDHIDRAFMKRLTDLPAMTPPAAPKVAAAGQDARAKPLCAGCGSKITGDALAAALLRLPPPVRQDVLSRPGDDAAILATGDARQVLTTDHLRAFTGDPVLMARIATVHALGDIWAMGAAPQAGLASVVLPRMSEALQARTLADILGAMSEVLRDAGGELVGGHSTMGAETTLGLSLTGLCEGPPIGLDGARPGDALILTRPIGVGTLLAAEMAGAANGRHVMAMLHAMARPQGDAAAVLSGAHAMTDVTGFGLAGHLMAICRASGVGAEIALDAVPLYAGAAEMAEAGHASVLHAANRRGAPVEGGAGAALTLLHDPQTAGGLLAAVAPGAAADLVARLRAAGHEAARIGTVTDGGPRIRCA
ncbi:selenide, water dikinase SelD [Jannaschia ovalis]|uniref:Selenide, water dikinase SelD n=1 Tax=Jannaschia ovalis TaxID=3038773 RepID=A0ABY8LBR5_9RHOB|nr:selenide, water dikinase SelD [Jannaschia sp. GRR-S6-38]WGH78062.1 selenide, water dikinase SelD [Jannaschia sp. GRR-S6-38]